jgi:tape measure domain-containing protein
MTNLGTATLYFEGDDSRLRRSLGRLGDYAKRAGRDAERNISGGISDGARSGGRRAEGYMRSAGRSSGSAFSRAFNSATSGIGVGISSALTQAVLGALRSIGSQVGSVISTGAGFEQTALSFEVMLKSGERAKKLFGDIKDFASSTPFNVEKVIRGSKQLVAYGIEAEKVKDILRQLGDISAGSGKDINELIAIYGKVKAADKVDAKDLMQLGDAGIPILDLFAKQLGIAKSEVRDLVSTGEVGFADLDKALRSMSQSGGMFENLMAKLAETTGGKLTNLSDKFVLLKAKLFEVFQPQVNAAVERLSMLMTWVADAAERLGTFQLPDFGAMLSGFGDNFDLDAIASSAQSFFSQFIQSAQQLIAFVATIVNGLLSWESQNKAVSAATSTIIDLVSQVTQFVGEAAESFQRWASESVVVQRFADSVNFLIQSIVELVQNLLGAESQSKALGTTLGALQRVVQFLLDVVLALITAVTTIIGLVIRIVAELVKWVSTGQALNDVMNAVLLVVKLLLSPITGLIDLIKALVKIVIEWISKFKIVRDIGSTMWSIMEPGLRPLIDFFNTLTKTIGGTIDNLKTLIGLQAQSAQQSQTMYTMEKVQEMAAAGTVMSDGNNIRAWSTTDGGRSKEITSYRQSLPHHSGRTTGRYGEKRDYNFYTKDTDSPFVGVKSPVTGQVVYAGYDPGGYGNFVRLKSDQGEMMQFGHFQQNLVKTGDRVKMGQSVAIQGTTGNSSGYHVDIDAPKHLVERFFNLMVGKIKPAPLKPPTTATAKKLAEVNVPKVTASMPSSSVTAAPTTQQIETQQKLQTELKKTQTAEEKKREAERKAEEEKREAERKAEEERRAAEDAKRAAEEAELAKVDEMIAKYENLQYVWDEQARNVGREFDSGNLTDLQRDEELVNVAKARADSLEAIVPSITKLQKELTNQGSSNRLQSLLDNIKDMTPAAMKAAREVEKLKEAIQREKERDIFDEVADLVSGTEKKYDRAQTSINRRVQMGGLTDRQAQEERTRLAAQYAEEVRAAIPILQELHNEIKDPEVKEALDNMVFKFEGATAKAVEMGRELAEQDYAESFVGKLNKGLEAIGNSGLGDIFKSLVRGGKDFLDVLEGIVGKVADLAIDLAVNALFSGPLSNLFGGSFLGGIGLFNKGGTVGNYAGGGAVSAALRREGPRSVLAALTPGEEVLSVRNGDAQAFRRIKRSGVWNNIKGYSRGGTVTRNGGHSFAGPSGGTFKHEITRINNHDFVTYEDFQAGMSQAAQSGALIVERNMQSSNYRKRNRL